jgi:hypothetical protein
VASRPRLCGPDGVGPSIVAVMSDSVAWLVLIYKVPTEPSRQRATVWRRLKALGAVYLQDGIAALPDSSSAERSLRALQNEIKGFGGVGYLLRSEPVTGEAEVRAVYNRARNDEYEEILDRCRDFEAEIEREVRNQHLTYAELEENDEDLTKLKNWLEPDATRSSSASLNRSTKLKVRAEGRTAPRPEPPRLTAGSLVATDSSVWPPR